MIKILNTKQTRELDGYTIEHEPIASIDLMERASKAFVNWFVQKVDGTKKVGVVCGTGNNGGDGLAIARLLQDWGYQVKVWIVRGLVPQSGDFKINLERLQGKLEINDIIKDSDQGLFADREVLIDAIFGSGLSRPVEGIYAQAIRCMNAAHALRIAVDIPSGLSADQHLEGEIIQADYTVTFQIPKLSFFFPQSFRFTGEWIAVDIGLSKKFISEVTSSNFLLTQKSVRKILKPRLKFDHKGSFGHGLMICGSYGKMGAAVLASKAALRSGVGLLTCHVPKIGYDIIQTAVPDAMVSIDENEYFLSSLPELERFSAIAIGPGIGQDLSTVVAFERLLKSFPKPMVIDADALNILSLKPELRKLVPEKSILTPHPKEFERLVGKWGNDFERLEKQKKLAAELKSVVILKGAFTSIATPEGIVYFNPTGNPGMARGGSGDVLTGILAGILSQSYAPEEAGILGVYLHGLAGDIGVQEKSYYSLTASDLVEFLPQAFKTIRN